MRGELAPHPRLERWIAEWANGGTDEALHRVTSSAEQLSDLVRLSLPHHDAPPRVLLRRGDPEQLHLPRNYPGPFDRRPPLELLHRRRIRHPAHLDGVLSPNPVARVAQAQRQLAVVGQHQQPLGVEIQAPDGKHALLDGPPHQVHHRRAPLRVIDRGDHPGGLVQQQVTQRLWRL